MWPNPQLQKETQVLFLVGESKPAKVEINKPVLIYSKSFLICSKFKHVVNLF